MSEIEQQKVELIEQLIQATRDGLHWERFPGAYVGEWKGHRVIIEWLPDEPLSLYLKEHNRLEKGVLTSTELVKATVRESEPICNKLVELNQLVRIPFDRKDEASNARAAERDHQEEAARARREQEALNRILPQ